VATKNEAFGNVLSFDALMGGSIIEEDVVVEEVLVSDEEEAPRSIGRSEAFGNVRTMDELLGGGRDDSNKKMDRGSGKPPFHALKNDPLEESIVEIVEEEDLSNTKASSYSGKTPRAPNSRRPINIQDSIGSYIDDEFEGDEEYSVDFDNNALSSSISRVSPRAEKMQHQHQNQNQHQNQHRANSTTMERRGGATNSARTSPSSKKKSRAAGTQASGTQDVGCQAMLVPLPPLGYDPMLYFGSPAMMMGRGGMMRGGMMGMYGGGMMSPSMSRMPPPGSFYGSSYHHPYHHPAMGPMHAWSGGGSSHSKAGSPGSSVAPSAPVVSPAATASSTASSKKESEGQEQTDSSSSSFGGDIFSAQMEASRVAFQNQLDTIRAHIQKTHARVAATAQAAGYQDYTTLVSTQEYIAKMRKPQPINFDDAISMSGTKYEADL
jgi:hypothetical protein